MKYALILYPYFLCFASGMTRRLMQRAGNLEMGGLLLGVFVSDNNGFDWQFINWYFWHFTGANPFGHSSTNLGSCTREWSRCVFRPAHTP
jgi:hypothetical protein